MVSDLQLESDARGTLILVRTHAGARRNAVLGVRVGMLRVAVSEAPEKGKANKAVSALLSKVIGVPKSNVQLVAGTTTPRKQFLIVGVEAEQVRAVLAKSLPKE